MSPCTPVSVPAKVTWNIFTILLFFSWTIHANGWMSQLETLRKAIGHGHYSNYAGDLGYHEVYKFADCTFASQGKTATATPMPEQTSPAVQASNKSTEAPKTSTAAPKTSTAAPSSSAAPTTRAKSTTDSVMQTETFGPEPIKESKAPTTTPAIINPNRRKRSIDEIIFEITSHDESQESFKARYRRAVINDPPASEENSKFFVISFCKI